MILWLQGYHYLKAAVAVHHCRLRLKRVFSMRTRLICAGWPMIPLRYLVEHHMVRYVLCFLLLRPACFDPRMAAEASWLKWVVV